MEVERIEGLPELSVFGEVVEVVVGHAKVSNVCHLTMREDQEEKFFWKS